MTPTQYHFIGIGGIGMSGLARLLLQQNKRVSGSDISETSATQYLASAGAEVFLGHNKAHVPAESTVVYSTDIAPDNPELIEARMLGCPVWHRSDLLAALMKPHEALLIAGTHGKTTTTALASHVFRSAGKDPSFAVGGLLHGLQCSSNCGSGPYFIAEADESDGTFLKYDYKAAIVTNIDTDHLAHFGNWDALVEAFRSFMMKAPDPELLLYCIDDPTLANMNVKGTSYGFSERALFRAVNFRQNGFTITYDVLYQEKIFRDVHVSLTGLHNARNSLAVFALCIKLGLDEEEIRTGLSTFSGVKRRLEKKGECEGVEVYDDYAHHPTEIQATLHALRLAVGKRRIIAVFQPHRYSRMRFLLKNFADTFNDADIVLITDLYTAKEPAITGVNSEVIFQEIKRFYPANTYFIPRDFLVEGIREMLKMGDVLITMGAGDITKVGSELCQQG